MVWLNVLKWIGTIVSIVSLVVGIIIAIKNGHFKKLLNLYHITKQKVAEAERIFGKGAGEKKLAYVFAQLVAYCAKNKIKCSDAEIENKINDEVKFMNTHKELETESFPTNNQTEFISENVASDSTHNQTILGRM